MKSLRYLILLFALLFVALLAAPASAQTPSWQISGLSLPQLRQNRPADPTPVLRYSYNNKLPFAGAQKTQAPADMPSVYCFDDLAFFCKIEVRLEKKLRFPVKFRLGDVPYVDWMEGKRSTY